MRQIRDIHHLHVLCDTCGLVPVSRWRADTLTDTLGDAMAFTYVEHTIDQGAFNTEQSRPTKIGHGSIDLIRGPETPVQIG